MRGQKEDVIAGELGIHVSLSLWIHFSFKSNQQESFSATKMSNGQCITIK